MPEILKLKFIIESTDEAFWILKTNLEARYTIVEVSRLLEEPPE